MLVPPMLTDTTPQPPYSAFSRATTGPSGLVRKANPGQHGLRLARRAPPLRLGRDVRGGLLLPRCGQRRDQGGPHRPGRPGEGRDDVHRVRDGALARRARRRRGHRRRPGGAGPRPGVQGPATGQRDGGARGGTPQQARTAVLAWPRRREGRRGGGHAGSTHPVGMGLRSRPDRYLVTETSIRRESSTPVLFHGRPAFRRPGEGSLPPSGQTQGTVVVS